MYINNRNHFELREIDEGCICYKAYHSSWKFGRDYIDITNSIGEYLFNEPFNMPINNNGQYYVDDGLFYIDCIDVMKRYAYINIEEYHHIYNPYTDNLCLCCNKKILQKNSNSCDDCGCNLCGNCFVMGRSNTIKLCYNCRMFGFNKNYYFYMGDKSIKLDTFLEYDSLLANEDWEEAAWYF